MAAGIIKLVALLLCGTRLGTALSSPVTWRSFAGTHYSFDDASAARVGFLRGPPGPPWIWGASVYQGSNTSAQPRPQGTEAILGPFSGKYLFMDWRGIARGIDRGRLGVNHTNDRVATLATDADITALPGLAANNGWRYSSTPAPEMWPLLINNTAVWQDIVYAQVVRYASLNPASPMLYWQLGNEINGCMFNTTALFGLNASQCSFDGPIWNSDQQLRAYADLFFAPTAAAVRRASVDVFGRPDTVQIVLGSVANAFAASSLSWLDQLLNHVMSNPVAAPGMHGRRVHEVTAIITFHYLVTCSTHPCGTPQQLAASNDVGSGSYLNSAWRLQLNSIWQKWVGSGLVNGMWATEEHGKKGDGAVTAVKVYARWLDWWLAPERRTNFTYDIPAPRPGMAMASTSIVGSRGRAAIWGQDLSKKGGTALDGMMLLGELMGDGTLSTVAVAPILCRHGACGSVRANGIDSAAIDTYAFRASGSGGMIPRWQTFSPDAEADAVIAIIFLNEAAASATSVAVSGVCMKNTNSMAGLGANVTLLSAAAPPKHLSATVTSDGCVAFTNAPIVLTAQDQETIVARWQWLPNH